MTNMGGNERLSRNISATLSLSLSSKSSYSSYSSPSSITTSLSHPTSPSSSTYRRWCCSSSSSSSSCWSPPPAAGASSVSLFSTRSSRTPFASPSRLGRRCAEPPGPVRRRRSGRAAGLAVADSTAGWRGLWRCAQRGPAMAAAHGPGTNRNAVPLTLYSRSSACKSLSLISAADCCC